MYEISSKIIVGVVVVVVLLIFSSGYLKAPPDMAFIISGLKRRTLIGKAGFRIPLIERLDKLSLKLIQIDIKTTNSVPTADYINIRVDANVNVKISSNKELLEVAAQNFLNQKADYIKNVAREVLEGNMREIVGRMKLEEMVSDRQKFAKLVTENAGPDLEAMGLEIISFNVQNFTDDKSVIENLGIDNTESIRKKAAIAKAEAQRDIEIAQSEAAKLANDAQVESNTRIAEKNNALAIKMAELKVIEDTKKAEADAAYQIQQEVQRKSVEITRQEADIARAEKEVILKEREAEAAERRLDAEVKKKAEAERYAREQQADADLYTRQREADAKLFEQKREADAAKYNAEADLYTAQKLAEAKEAEANGIKQIGLAEAEAIAAKGEAEARAMDKKADAYRKYNGAAMAEMLIKVLPDVAEKVAEPLKQIDKITIIGDGSGVGQVANNVPIVMSKLFETVKETTGIDLGDIVRADTYDAKVNRNVTVAGLPDTVNVDMDASNIATGSEEATGE